MIHATELTKRFGRIVAVDGVNLQVGDHGIVGLLGPNGAGKTTLMRILTGFIPMSEGNAMVAGFDVFEEPAKVKARVGYLPETPPLYPELTIGEYLRFVAEIRGIPRASRLSQVGEAMEKVGLRRRENELLATLSKGYRQRVGLAQAIVHRPPLLILDEPTSGLDPAQLVPIRQLIRDIGEERLVLFSTHVLQEVKVLCDRVIVINRGKIVGDGSKEQLARNIGGGPWLELVVESAGEDAVARLAALSAVEEVTELAPGRFRLVGGAELAPSVTELAVSLGWRVKQVADHQASLQEVFLSLVEAEQ